MQQADFDDDSHGDDPEDEYFDGADDDALWDDEELQRRWLALRA